MVLLLYEPSDTKHFRKSDPAYDKTKKNRPQLSHFNILHY